MRSILCASSVVFFASGQHAGPQDKPAGHQDKQAGHQDTQHTSGSDSGYQKYMDQYAGQYMKGAQSGGDYQKYMKQYAGKYTQGGGGYQKYMKQYAGGYMQGDGQAGGDMKLSADTSAQGGGAGYQKYMKQYADTYTQGGGGGYQKYMKQYAGGYMQGDSQAGGDMKLYADKSAQGGDAGYQKYMKQYSDKYTQGGAGGYQKYMKQYAGKYMQGAGKDQQHQGAAAKSGAELLASSRAETGDVASSAHSARAEPERAGPDADAQASAWKAYGQAYGGDWMPAVRNTSDPKDWRDAFLNKYAVEYQQRQAQAKEVDGKFADAPPSAAACHNLTALKKWRDHQSAQIAAYIPKGFQKYAKESLASEYNTNKARIIAEEKLADGNKTKAPAEHSKTPAAKQGKPSVQAVERPMERATQKADQAAEQPAERAPKDIQEPVANAGEPATSERFVKQQQVSVDKPAVEAASSKAALSSASLASAVPAAAPRSAPMLLIFAAFALPIGGMVALFTVRARRYQPLEDADTGYFMQP